MKKVAIIGSGPSGLTAGIYTSRANLNTTIFTGLQPGGQLTTTTEIENFPSAFNISKMEGLQGPELMDIMQKQAEHFGCKIKFAEEIVSIKIINNDSNPKKPQFELKNSYDETDVFDAVIIATGAKAKYLGLPDEEKWVGQGYHTCATCDGYFYKNKVIAVVGGGDSAFEEANYLTKHAEKVYLINRTDKFKASKIMQERGLNNSKIEVILNSTVEEFIISEGKFSGVKLLNSTNNQITDLEISGLFVAIGHNPNSQFVKDILSVDEAGYLIPRGKLLYGKLANQENVEPNWAKYGNMSEVEGIFIAGDIEDKVYRQAITAAGDGCRSAIDCERWLEE
jgi:thioredoxin reductase (NADPH)